MKTNPKIHILCMEDDPDIVNLLRRKLVQSGYEVDFAPNGNAGLKMYDAGNYDVLAVDQNMPELDGLSVLRTLAMRENFPPTIMVTGSGNEKVAVEALKLGASDYIVKDVEAGFLELLPTVIEQVLAKQKILREKEEALGALERRNQDLALLNEAGQTFTATLDLKELARALLQMATQLVGAKGSSIWLWDEKDQDWLTCEIVFNEGEHYSPLNLKLRPGEGVAGWVAKYGKSTIVESVMDDTRFTDFVDEQTGFHTTCLVAVPLLGRNGLIGVLEIVNKVGGVFNKSHLTLVESLASPAAIAIDNAYMVTALRQRARELQERNEELDAFAHTVAHDLKGPLASILGYADVLSDFLDSMNPEEVDESLQAILRSGKKMGAIIDELLLLAGVRQMDIIAEPILMSKVIDEVCRRLTDLIQEHQAEISYPSQWGLVLGYAPWIEEVWINYITNAIKYGGSPPKIELGVDEPQGDMLRFWIKDNGSGLSKQAQQKLFTPFTRLSSIKVEGYGLGLSIVSRIVHKLNGEVGVESKPGQGSLFYFTLPKVTNLY